MKRRIARHKRTLALLLTLCLLFTCLPLQAMSAGGTAEETDISNEVYIVDEDITKRGEYEKHFLCSDGTYRAVTYAEPVHYYDSSTGTWQDNDVALALNAASTRYEAQSGSFAVSFAKSYAAPALSATGTMGEEASNALTTSGSIAQNAAASQTVTMSNGIYPISWTTAVKPEFSVAEGTAVQKSAALGAPRLLTRTPAASILTSAEAEADAQQPFTGKPISDSGSFAAANRISVAEYGNIAQAAGQSTGVSLRYSISQHKIKEDIVISNKSAVTDFVTTLDVGALTAVKQEDGSVLLVDEYGDTAYTVGVPFMYDADYNVSYNVAVTVEQTGSVCRITYAPDREWLNAAGRVYPVVLDPTVTSSEYYANIVDTYVTQADSNNHSGEGNLVVGIKNGKLNRAYLRINNLPAIPAGVTPASAQLLIKQGGVTVFEGVSKAASAAARAGLFGGYTAVSAYEVAERKLALPLVVYDLDDKLLAGDVKLLLCDRFGDEAPALLLDGEKAERIPLYEADRAESYSPETALVLFDIPLLKKKRFDLDDFIAVMRRLRAPDGCPWDRVQTHESIRINLIEEAYELVDAIDRKDPERMREEAGDVLMQAVFHTLMEEEAGNFNMTDVISEVTEKLITRHTHVFGQDKAAGADGALSVWEKNKMTEKHQKTFSDSVNDVPEGFPALLRAEKVVKRTGKGGWKDSYEAAEEALFAAEKRLAAAEGGNTDEALGELLLAAVRLGKLKGGDAEQALLDKVKAVQREYTAFEALVLADGKDVNALTPEERKEYERRAHESL